jgi:hypothetical protein
MDIRFEGKDTRSMKVLWKKFVDGAVSQGEDAQWYVSRGATNLLAEERSVNFCDDRDVIILLATRFCQQEKAVDRPTEWSYSRGHTDAPTTSCPPMLTIRRTEPAG